MQEKGASTGPTYRLSRWVVGVVASYSREGPRLEIPDQRSWWTSRRPQSRREPQPHPLRSRCWSPMGPQPPRRTKPLEALLKFIEGSAAVSHVSNPIDAGRETS